jgi:hypothetical protein
LGREHDGEQCAITSLGWCRGIGVPIAFGEYRHWYCEHGILLIQVSLIFLWLEKEEGPIVTGTGK